VAYGEDAFRNMWLEAEVAAPTRLANFKSAAVFLQALQGRVPPAERTDVAEVARGFFP